MIRSGTVIALAAGVFAFGVVRVPALGATDPGAVNPYETTINRPLVDPGALPVRPASPVARERPPTGNPLWAVPLRSLSATRERPIFSPSRRPPPLPVIAAPFVPPVKPPPPKPPEPDHPLLTLMGTIVGETEGIGIFFDQVTHDVVRLKTGQDHAGWLLRSIQGREAKFQKDLRDATLTLPAPGTTEQTAPLPIAAPAAAGDAWMDGDGRMISPPPRKTPQPVVAPPAAPTPAGGDAWMGAQYTDSSAKSLP